MDPSSVEVKALSPNTGPVGGSSQVTVTGEGFQPGAIVWFGGVRANTVFRDATALVADAPAHSAGRVDVRVVNPDGLSGTLPVGYTYVAPLEHGPLSKSVLTDVTLSGVVYELAADSLQRIGIEGATVYCEPCGEETHSFALTDSDGVYRFTGVWTEGNPAFPTRVLIYKAGYADPPGLRKPTPPNPSGAGWREVVVNGIDTQFDAELVRQ
jgi:hypothetical protein